MTSRRLSRAAVSGLAVLALGGLAACGSDDSAESAAPATSAGASQTPAAPTTTDPTTTDPTTTDPGQPEEMTAGASVTRAQMADIFTRATEAMTTAHVAMSMGTGAGTIQAEGDIDMTTDPAEMAMTMDMGTGFGSVDMRLVDGDIYMNLGSQTKNKFIKMSEDDMEAGGMDLTESMNPAESLDEFLDAYKSAKFVGSDAAGDHYRVVLDTSKIGDDLAGAAAGGLPKSLTMELWIRSDAISKVSIEMGSLGSTTMTYSKLGEPVTITAPKPSQITTMPGM